MHEDCAAGAARTAKLARRAEGRMPAVKKRVTRSSAGGVEALALAQGKTNKSKMDDQLRC